MAEQTGIHNKRDGLITLQDSGAAIDYDIAFEVGDFSFDAPRESVSVYLDRGKLGADPSLRKVDDQPVTGSFSFYLRDFGSASEITGHDAVMLLQSGGFALGNIATTTSVSDVETWTLSYTADGTAIGQSDKTLQFDHARITASVAEGDPSTVSCSFTAYIISPSLV